MDNTEIIIRKFTANDWDEVCSLYEAAALVELDESGIEKSQFKPMSEEESQEYFFSINTALVACMNSRIVGFVAWRDRGEWLGTGYLSWLYVDPAYHQRGIGTLLVNEALPYLGTQAWTLTKSGNHPAIKLYKKFGMQIVGNTNNRKEVRLALPSSNKYDPNVPDFGR